MSKPIIGILTWRQDKQLEEPSYLRHLIREGQGLGAITFLFSHQDVFYKQQQIRGFVPTPEGGWKSQLFPWPDVVIDRCRKGELGYRALRKKKGLFTYANSTYTNKWNATRLFSQEPALARWIPKTLAYSPSNLSEMLKQFPLVYIKPGNGTGGRSILKIEKTSTGYRLLGRAKNLVLKSVYFSSSNQLSNWIDRWVRLEKIRDGNFMIQQGLDLSLIPNRVADTRLLIQKNEHGVWEITGLGVRVGPKGSPTSNLHGGGKPMPFLKLMTARFGPEKTKQIYEECKQLAHQVVKTIENYFGDMMEFGLDIGVDVQGKVWLIEVNPKPGRDIFKEMGHVQLYKQAVQRPIQYALHLIKSKQKHEVIEELILPVNQELDTTAEENVEPEEAVGPTADE